MLFLSLNMPSITQPAPELMTITIFNYSASHDIPASIKTFILTSIKCVNKRQTDPIIILAVNNWGERKQSVTP